MIDYYIEENRNPSNRKVLASPSGRFTLTTDTYKTKDGCWNYSRGRVYDIDGNLVADVKRNYSSFWSSWLTTLDGREWLICGESYMSQTLVNLETGEAKNAEDHGQEDRFCWVSANLLEDGKTLLVEGCYWACPYEYRLVDFSNPDAGWPTMSFDGSLDLEDDEKTSVRTEEDLIVWREDRKIWRKTGESEREIESRFSSLHGEHIRLEKYVEGASVEEIAQAKKVFDDFVEEYYSPMDRDDYVDSDYWGRKPNYIIKLRKRLEPDEDGHLLEIIEEWKSPEKLESEARYNEYEQKRKAELADLRSKDEIFSFFNTPGRTIYSVYPSQVMQWQGETNPFYNTFDLEETRIEWGADHGDIVVRRRGHSTVLASFPRTVQGAQQALSFS